jgi:hypothetical protein
LQEWKQESSEDENRFGISDYFMKPHLANNLFTDTLKDLFTDSLHEPITTRSLTTDYFHRKNTIWFHLLFEQAVNAQLSGKVRLTHVSRYFDRLKPGYRPGTIHASSLEHSHLIPDLLFQLVHQDFPSEGMWYCFETTMGNRPKVVTEKIEAYVDVLASQHLQYDFESSYQPRILFLFENEACKSTVMDRLAEFP